MTDSLFCPRCGVPLETTDTDALVCRPGDMELSHVAGRYLLAWTGGEERRSEPFSFRLGGRWHCPTDGTRMRESAGRLTCPECDRSLPGRLIYHLVEFHQHARDTD
jgi:hypothetical protein